MKIDTEQLLRPGVPGTPRWPAAAAWRATVPLLILAIAAILAIYWETAESIVAIWSRSETFAHGYLIAPISIVLIWTRRRAVAALVPSADWLGFLLLAGAGIAWLVAAAGGVQIVQQYAVVAMIPAAVIAIAGRHVARAFTFPLAFLFLGVPIGEALIPPLMEWTADFTVTALRMSFIPVYREGTFFTIPSGHWSVVEGCSGLRYLIASITVGTLYAYLNYQKFGKRALFVALSVIVPIIANGFRAYMIVMIAHLSDMRLALGVDHLIYGWVFFGIVMLLLFWIGSYWRDEPAAATPSAGDTAKPAAGDAAPRAIGAARPAMAGAAAAAAAAVGLAAAWPLYAAHLDRSIANRGPLDLAIPAPANGWTIETAPVTDWRPRYERAPASVFQTYRKGDRVVALYVGYYRNQQRGAELVTSTNIMVVQKHPVWSNVGESGRIEDFGKGKIDVRQTRLRSPPQRLLVWDWFHIANRNLTSPYVAKLLLAQEKLLGRGDDGAAIIVATPYDDIRDVAVETLREFVREMGPSIDASLAGVDARRVSALGRATGTE